jgi:hypothetical protein
MNGLLWPPRTVRRGGWGGVSCLLPFNKTVDLFQEFQVNKLFSDVIYFVVGRVYCKWCVSLVTESRTGN